MLYAILDCSDGGCDASYEAWGEPGELEGLLCELCGCALQAVAFSEADRNGDLPRSFDVQLRNAA